MPPFLIPVNLVFLEVIIDTDAAAAASAADCAAAAFAAASAVCIYDVTSELLLLSSNKCIAHQIALVI